MKIVPLAVLLCVISSSLPAQNLRIVNAASLSEGSVAPGSIVSIFGTRLAAGVDAAEDSAHPPASLRGVSVTIGGKAAALFYVSPTQINAVVDSATPIGPAAVSVVSDRGTQTGSVTVAADAAVGLFSLFGSGTRDGAILNAKTFRGGDFSVRTSDGPTHLALFATGPMNVKPAVTIGGIPVEVTFAGPAPCCVGLMQINVALPESLAGAGRVPVVATANGHASNTVEIVVLPPTGAKQFPDDEDNAKRNRELAALAYVPNTSLVLSTDQNDDVVRVVDISAKKVTQVIALPDGANPVGIAVNAAGTIAAVAESGTGKVALIDLKTFAVTKEIAAGAGASSVAIGGANAVVVNRDEDTITVIDLTAGAALKTIPVGRGPMSVTVDAATSRAAVTNQNDGTVSIIDLTAFAVFKPITLGASIRPQAIVMIPGSPLAFVTAPSHGPNGTVVLVNLNTGETSTIEANPERSGGATDAVYFNGKIYFANQTGGSVSILPVSATGAVAGAISTVKVDLGVRALAVDSKDGILVVSNEGTGTLVLVSLSSNEVVGRISGVRAGDDDDKDDRSDRGKAANMPTIASVSPQSAKAGATVALTITGANLTGATEVSFGPEHGNPNGKKDDAGFTVKNIVVTGDGKQLTASLSIDASVKQGARLVRVHTPNGDSGMRSDSAVFTVLP